MQQNSTPTDLPRRRIGIAEHVIVSEPAVLTTSGLGSCVGIGLYDETGRGGFVHCMLPAAAETSNPNSSKPAKFVDTAVELLHEKLLAAGARPGALRAKLAGGSDMLGLSDDLTVGERNTSAAEDALATADIPLVATETGGQQGRSLKFETATGQLQVVAADGTTTVL